MIRRLRKDLVTDSELPSQSPLTPDGLPVHSYHAVIQQLKQQKHELTALQQAERRKAKASDTLSAAVLANLSCGVLFLNASGLVRQANSAARKILGFASPIGMRISDLFHSSTLQSAHHDKINLEEALQPALKGESVVRGLTLNYASPDGQQRVIELTVSPVLAEPRLSSNAPTTASSMMPLSRTCRWFSAWTAPAWWARRLALPPCASCPSPLSRDAQRPSQHGAGRAFVPLGG